MFCSKPKRIDRVIFSCKRGGRGSKGLFPRLALSCERAVQDEDGKTCRPDSRLDVLSHRNCRFVPAISPRYFIYIRRTHNPILGICVGPQGTCEGKDAIPSNG
jgi:hypothetical protein